jgi:hypothetical protein
VAANGGVASLAQLSAAAATTLFVGDGIDDAHTSMTTSTSTSLSLSSSSLSLAVKNALREPTAPQLARSQQPRPR